MNVPGTDNRQFALNIMHWLSGVKFPAQAETIASKPKPTRSADAGAFASSTPTESHPADAAKSVAMPATATAVASTRRPDPGHTLSSAEIAAESEPSIAMITGDGSVGTGFLVRPGILATNCACDR